MKLVAPVIGTTAIRVSPDDVVPPLGILQRDLVKFVGDLYDFNVRPVIEPGAPAIAQPILTFQSGQYVSETEKIPITHLVIFPDGDSVTAHNTDQSDAVLTHFLSQMDERLGYRFGEAKPTPLHVSFIVAELDRRFTERHSFISTIKNLVNDSLAASTGHSYGMKRLAFGIDPAAEQNTPLSVRQVVPPDFIIERRANEPAEKNRFFCGAPVSTHELVALLERIERAVIELN